MKADLYNLKLEKIKSITLPESVFSVDYQPKLISQLVRIYLSNQRSSGAKVKNRAEVSGTTKKMWSQKGTGRARHGSAKAPIFVGGGSAHGPRGNRNYRLKTSGRTSYTATCSLLSKFAKDKKIFIIDKISAIEPKTKTAVSLLSGLKINGKVGIITKKHQDNVARSFKNISGVSLITLSSLNPYLLSLQDSLIISYQAVTSLSHRQ